MMSWKIMAASRPRMRSSCFSVMVSSSWPPKRMDPPVTWPWRLSSPRMDRAVMLLPQPLSPTRQTISPGATEKDTLSVFGTRFLPLSKAISRSFTSRIGSNALMPFHR